MENGFVIGRNLVRRFENDKGVGPVSIILKTNFIYSIIGPNASGKTTLIKCLSRIEKLDSGKVCYSDEEFISSDHILFSVVFQQPEPWPHLSVLENIILPLRKVLGLTEADAKIRAEIEILRFGLSNHYKALAHQLSGGLKQRVVQARALAMQPTFLFLDEPTSALDPEWTELFGRIIVEYAKEDRMVLIVSHQLNFLKRTSDKIFFLCNGVIIETGTPNEIFQHPKNLSLIKFIENS